MSRRRQDALLADKERQKAIRLTQQAVDLIGRGVKDPDNWHKTMCRLEALRAMSIFVDNTLAAVDEFLPFVTFDGATQQAFKVAQRDLDSLLDKMRASSIKYFGHDCLAHGEKHDEEYCELADEAMMLGAIIEELVGYYMRGSEKWRRVELAKTMMRLVPQTAREARVAEVHKELTGHLAELMEKAKGLLPADQEATVVDTRKDGTDDTQQG